MNTQTSNSNINPNYEYFYWGAIRYFDLSGYESLTLFLISGLAKKSKKCYASKKTLAETLNVSQPTIFKAIKKLVNKRLIEYTGEIKYGIPVLNITDEFQSFIESMKGVEIYN